MIYRNLKTDIIAHLNAKGNYDGGVDDYLIDILLENLEYSRKLKTMLDKNGIITTLLNGNGIPTMRENPALAAYSKCLNNIFHCSVKLGISRKDRITLKIMEEKASDDFDNDFS